MPKHRNFKNEKIGMLALVVAFVLVICLVPLLGTIAPSFGWVDTPDHRKHHTGQIPLVGGLAIILAFAITKLMLGIAGAPSVGFWLASGMLFATAFLDDRFPIRARYRFAVQLMAGVTICYFGNTVFDQMGWLIGPFNLSLGPVFGLIVTVLFVAAFINALNFTDGADGLAGGFALVSLFWFFVAIGLIALRAEPRIENISLLKTLLAVIGATAGFMLFNLRTVFLKRAKVFLGDGGSYFLGFVLAWLAVHSSSAFGDQRLPFSSALWILALPIVDMFAVITRRLINGGDATTPDRKHMHHMMPALGFPVERSVPMLLSLQFLCGFIGVAGWFAQLPAYWMFWAFVVAALAYSAATFSFWRRRDQPEHDAGSAELGNSRLPSLPGRRTPAD